MTTITLLANDRPGLETARYLAARPEGIARLYIHDPDDNAKLADEIVDASGCSEQQIFMASSLRDPLHVAQFVENGTDWIISAWWGHILSKQALGAAKAGSVNFHPSLLPLNRGAYPHLHSILDDSPTGVTLHAMDAGVDTGPIYVQRKVSLYPDDTAKDIHLRLQREMVDLFTDNWPRIMSNELSPSPQNEASAVTHYRDEIHALDALDLDATMTVGQVINILRARSYGDHGFAYFQAGEKQIFVNLRLGTTPNFSSDDSLENKL